MRLTKYYYSRCGYYYITICSKNRENLFCEIENVVGAALASARVNIKLSKIGQIINHQWNDIPNQYKNIELDEYVIMPNHIHGIFIINKRAEASAAPTMSHIIRSYKSKCTMDYLTYINADNLNISGKILHRSFYDHIIRNDKSLQEIREYIINNPVNWETDEENIYKLTTKD